MNVEDCLITDQIFSWYSKGGTKEYHWNVSKALRDMAAGKLEPVAHIYIDITESDYLQVLAHNGINEAHLDKITAEAVKVPIVFVEFPPDEEDSEVTHVLIDGNHRFVKTYRDGGRRIAAVVFLLEDLMPYVLDIAKEASRNIKQYVVR